MRSLNKVQIIGNLGADPEVRALENGTVIAKLRIATSDRWKDKQTGERREKTEWHYVTFFGPLAEVCGQYLTKGSQLYVEGSLTTRKWQAQDGSDRYSTEVKGREMLMLGGKKGGGSAAPSQAPLAPETPDLDDDIPF